MKVNKIIIRCCNIGFILELLSFLIIRHFSVTAGPLSSASSRTGTLSQGDVSGVKASHTVVKRRAELYAETIGPEMLVR